MRLLLDSHALVWAVDEPTRLGPRAVAELKKPANILLVSATTIWEIAIKVGLKKLSISQPYQAWMSTAIADLGATILPITIEYAAAQAALATYHRDPFDRLIVAQAQVENLPIVSSDSTLDQYRISRLW